MLQSDRKLFRWGPISGCPLFMYYTIQSSFAPMQKLLGHCYPESIITFQNDKVTWFLDNEDFVVHSKQFVEDVILDVKKRLRYLDLWKTRTKSFMEIIARTSSRSLLSLSNEELTALFSEFSAQYFSWWEITMSVELYMSIETLLGEKLKMYFPQEHPKEYNKAFAILTSPPVLSFYRQEEKELLEILPLSKDAQRKALKEHQKKYHWIYNSYLSAKPLTVRYFEEELRKLQGSDHKALLHEIEKYETDIKKQKEEIISTIHPSEEMREFIAIFEVLSPLQDERKMYNFQADYILEKFADEFSRRTKIPVQNIKLLLPAELEQIFSADYSALINERKKAFTLDCTAEEIVSSTAEEAVQIVHELEHPKEIDQSIIHGILASSGDSYYFRGPAKVILDIKDIGRVEEGDVLVTTMTSPDFVIGMKKAGAIITDTGGILCHAAIVSREFKIPCIVGTQVATTLISDGDIIELHCGRATVRIIKHGATE